MIGGVIYRECLYSNSRISQLSCRCWRGSQYTFGHRPLLIYTEYIYICHATGYLNGSTHISHKNGEPRALSNCSHPYLHPRHLNDLKSYVVDCNTTISPSGNLEAIIGIRNPRIFLQALSTRYDNTTPTPTTTIL